MHGDLEPEEHHWEDEKTHVNDLWEDMDRLNSLYEELMWGIDDVLEFVPDYKNDRIIIKNKSKEINE
jgi:hypothetical protein|tara:strand:+ start:36 stop:236 length:201 start_codon:yes stop_codon:yes gene_type:complete